MRNFPLRLRVALPLAGTLALALATAGDCSSDGGVSAIEVAIDAGPFVPDPRLMLQQSILSAVKEDRDRLASRVGTHDRQRLDQYFTSVRQLEQQIDVLLSGPPDLESCRKAPAPGREDLGTEIDQSTESNQLMAGLLSLFNRSWASTPRAGVPVR